MQNRFTDYDYMLKIIIIGDPSVGKSSLLLRYVDDIYEESYICTIGVDFKIKSLNVNGKKVKLQIWDTAGQERFKPITQTYFRGAHGCIIVYDITEQDTFANITTWIHEYQGINSPEFGNNLVILGNKADLTEKRQVSMEKGQQLADQHNVPFREVSAKSSENVETAFATIASVVMSKMSGEEPKPPRHPSFKIMGNSLPGEDDMPKGPQLNKKKSKCC